MVHFEMWEEKKKRKRENLVCVYPFQITQLCDKDKLCPMKTTLGFLLQDMFLGQRQELAVTGISQSPLDLS